MAVPSQVEDGTLEAGDSAFLEQSYLTYIIPHGTDVDIKSELENTIAEKKPFEEIDTRSWLFFDETVDVLLILRTTGVDDATLKYYTGRLLLSIQAHVINTPTAERAGFTGASEVIYTGEVEDVKTPIASIEGGSGEGEGQAAKYAIWKAPIFLARPRLRLFGPSVVFTATASLIPDPAHYGEQHNGYLESGVPPGLNLLDAFARDPLLGGVRPRLSAMRVSRVAPATQIGKESFPMLKGLHNLSKKVYPAVHTRVRFSRPNAVPPSPALIAMLEIDFTPYFDCQIAVDKVSLLLPQGQVDDLNDAAGLGFPLECVAHDHITLMYSLAPQESDIPPRTYNRELSISIECTALINASCKPKLQMAWSTVLDFTLPVNPGFGTGVNKPFQRSHRPTQLSMGDGASFVSPSVARPDSIPSLEAAERRSLAASETVIPEFGITMTFTADQKPVYPGDEFVWTVFVVNRVAPTTGTTPISTPYPIPPVPPLPPRKLALLAIPKRRRNDQRIVRPPSTSGPGRRKSVAAVIAAQQQDTVPEVADAVLDENIVHAMQHSSLVDSTDVVCLSADVRVGPLAPNACFVTEMRFLALREGIVAIECVRVLDLGNQEHVDVRDLPLMVVERRGE
ncbi:unnamed protein product [Discula destructiva]